MNKEFEVPEMSGGRSDEPLDLGTVKLQVRTELKIGAEAPALEAKTLDGKALKLSDYRGKHVLLDFWASQLPSRPAEVPALKSIYDTYGKDGRLVMVSISLDPDVETPQAFVKKHGLEWTQAVLDMSSRNEYLIAYDIRRFPSAILIDAEGKILAKELGASAIKAELEKALPAK